MVAVCKYRLAAVYTESSGGMSLLSGSHTTGRITEYIRDLVGGKGRFILDHKSTLTHVCVGLQSESLGESDREHTAPTCPDS